VKGWIPIPFLPALMLAGFVPNGHITHWAIFAKNGINSADKPSTGDSSGDKSLEYSHE
jgi:hypothetical protein